MSLGFFSFPNDSNQEKISWLLNIDQMRFTTDFWADHSQATEAMITDFDCDFNLIMDIYNFPAWKSQEVLEISEAAFCRSIPQ